MSEEQTFRLALVGVIALTMLVTVYYRRQAASGGDGISHREEGYLFAVVLRLSGVALWAATMAYILVPSWVSWASLPVPVALRAVAVAAGACCSWLMYWTLSSLGRNLTDTVVTRKQAYLVTVGPYRWVRHPFYVTAALLMLAVTVHSANGLIGATSLLVLILLAWRTPKEEQMLIERFGDQYRRYRDRTGRFWPRWNR